MCLDALPLLVRSAGVKTYLYHWIRHLRRAAGDDAIRLFPSLGGLGQLDHERSLATPLRTWSALASLALINYGHLPLIDWCGPRADIFHSTNLLHRPPRTMRLTTTVHDLTTWILPEFHTAATRRADHSFVQVLRAADGIIAVSESTRRDLIRVLSIDERKVTAIHSGIAEEFFHVTPAQVAAARLQYRLDRPFALFLGTIEPRKNIGTLLDAWQALAPSLREEFELVLAGPAGWAGPELQARLDGGTPGVRYLGYVAGEHLPGLTAAATLFVYPSLYEGFGFPVAQAMAAGVPVVTSNISSLPEVAGDAGVLVDPRSQAGLSGALARLLLSPTERERRAAAGRLQAARFTWDECARRSLDFFQAIAG